jgi:hypothetical protein
MTHLTFPARWALIGLGLFSLPALAATASAQAEATYQKERAACLAGQTGQSRADCLREAAAARGEAGQARPATDTAAERRANALRRCQVHTEASARSACERLAAGEGTATGSVDGGGVIRSLTVPVPAPASTSASGTPPNPEHGKKAP